MHVTRHVSIVPLAAAVCLCVDLGASVAMRQSRIERPPTVPPATHWRIFVDDLHLRFGDTGRIRDVLRRLHHVLAPHSETLELISSGPSLLRRGPIVGHETSRNAIKDISGNGLKPRDILPDVSPDAMRELRYRAHTTLSGLLATIERFADEPPGPRQILVVTNGFAIASLGPIVKHERTLVLDEGDLHREIADVVRASINAGVRLSALELPAYIPSLMNAIGEPIDDWSELRSAMRNNLRDLTAPTGGVLLIGAESFEDGVAQLVRHSSQR